MVPWEWVAGALVFGFTVGSIFGARFGVRRDAHRPCDELRAEEGRRKYLMGYDDGQRGAKSF